METPKISVVVTAYNKQDSIKKCLDSILNSSYKNLEVIVVDDLSTDNTMSIVKEYSDDRLTILLNRENVGAGLSRRFGIQASSGDFVSLIDGDDYISEDFLESLINKQLETGADIVSGGITNINADGTTDIKLFGERVSEGNQKLLDYGKGTIIFLNNKIVRRSLYDIVTYSDKRYCEDTPTIIPLLYHANKVAYVNNAGYYYVHTLDTLTGSVTQFKHNIFCADCMVFLRNYFKDLPDGKFYLDCLNFNQFIGYVLAAKAANPSIEEVREYLPEYVNSMNYLIDNITIAPVNNTTSSK